MDDIIRHANSIMRQRDHVQRRVIEQLVQQCTGITHSQHWLLMILSDEDFKSQKDIAARLNISPAAVTMTLKKLETEGYIEKLTNPRDTRFNSVSLTPKGAHIVEFSKQLFRNIDHWVFSGFTEEEIRLFSSFTERIIQNLKVLETERPFDTIKEESPCDNM